FLVQQAQSHQFAADGRPFGARVFAADVVGGERVMLPFADAFGLGAAEDFHNMLDAHAEAAFLANAVDAGEKFLGGDGAVESLARGEAIVAGGAAIFRWGETLSSRDLIGFNGFRAREDSRPTIVLLTEIIQQKRAAAGGAFGVVDDLLE